MICIKFGKPVNLIDSCSSPKMELSREFVIISFAKWFECLLNLGRYTLYQSLAQIQGMNLTCFLVPFVYPEIFLLKHLVKSCCSYLLRLLMFEMSW